MNKPKEVIIRDLDGGEHTFIISRLPAIPAREVLAKYPISNIPKLGEYSASVDAMRLLMSYVAVPREGGEPLRLTTQALIDNHVPDGEALLRLEYAMLEYNSSFFGQGGLSAFVDAQIKRLLPSIISTLTASLQQSKPRDLRP